MSRPIRDAGAPAMAALALDPGNGIAARPIVAVGDRVRVGTLVARGEGDFALDVHATVAGVVRSLEVRPVPGAASTSPCLVIENDGTDEREAASTPVDWQAALPSDLLSRIRSAGVAGLGGAAFATHAKLAAARDATVSHLVLNGAECEPWICCDDALMRQRANEVVLGARVMQRAVEAKRVTIAIEDDKPAAIAAIEAALAAHGEGSMAVAVLPAVYPAGAERQLLAAVTGIEVPGDAWPPAVGLLCQNVGTAAAVAGVVTTGEPLTRRIVTITGSGVAEPANVEARLGTPIADLIEACGGYRGEPVRLIAGGSMTGRALPSDDAPVTQALNCVIVATAADLADRGSEMPCIRCGDCAAVCPAGLLPQSLLRAVASADVPGLERHGLADCIECGCCDHVCPSRIPLTARFVAARRERRLRLDDQRRAARARERFVEHERRLAAAAEAERREFEDARRRARGEEPS